MSTKLFLILTAEQADTVRGPTAPGSALDPIPLEDGFFALPAAVLDDPAHQQHHDLLRSLPVEEFEFPDSAPSDQGAGPTESVLIAISMGREDGTSAIAVNGQIVQTYDHNAVAPKPSRTRVTAYQKPNVFVGPKLKVERAKKHIRELEAALASFSQSQPYSLVEDVDPQTGQQLWRVRVNSAIPDEISVIIGDVVHNLRAALDYIICDLVRISNAVVPNAARDPAKTKAGFPLDATVKRHQPAKGKGKIGGIPAKAERLVARLKAHPGWVRQAWRLHFLDIRDKHNLIVTVAAATVQITATGIMPLMFQSADGGSLILAAEPPPGARPIQTPVGVPSTFRRVFPLHDNAEVYRSIPHVQEHFEVTGEVSFGEGEIAEGEPVLITLQQFAELVERTIVIFERAA